MPVYNDTPLATNPINQTQAPIRTNFQSIMSLIDVNHVDFSDPVDFGKHKWVTFPSQGAIPPAGSAFTGTEIGLFNALLSGQQELYVNRTITTGPTTRNIPMTASTLSSVVAPGVGASIFTYVPSGFIVQSGTFSVATSGVVVNFAMAFPTQIISVVVSLTNPLAAGNVISVGASNITTAGFTVRGAQFQAGAFIAATNPVNGSYIAIGY